MEFLLLPFLDRDAPKRLDEDSFFGPETKGATGSCGAGFVESVAEAVFDANLLGVRSDERDSEFVAGGRPLLEFSFGCRNHVSPADGDNRGGGERTGEDWGKTGDNDNDDDEVVDVWSSFCTFFRNEPFRVGVG